MNTAHQVSNIRENWKSPATTRILEKVQDIVSRDGDVRDQNLARQSLKSPVELKAEGKSIKGEEHVAKLDSDIRFDQNMEEEEDKIVESIRNTYKHMDNFEIKRADQRDLLKVTVPVYGVQECLRFTCRRFAKGPDDWWYRTMCIMGRSMPKERESITRCLERRSNKRDLLSTLVC